MGEGGGGKGRSNEEGRKKVRGKGAENEQVR